jgi:hypothetical protein
MLSITKSLPNSTNYSSTSATETRSLINLPHSHLRTQNAPTLSIITDGGLTFSREYLEQADHLATFPTSTIYCNELIGGTALCRSQFFLKELKNRIQRGEFSPYIPVFVFMHGVLADGELMLTDQHDSFRIPASVLFHVLAGSSTVPAPGNTRQAPVVLSCCMAEKCAGSLAGYPRPVLINGSRHELSHVDADAVFRRCIYEVQKSWNAGETVDADQLFEAIASTSGEPVHRIEGGDWLTHDVLRSVTSIDSIDGSQEILYLRAMLAHGSADKLAEAILLFGMDGLRSHFDWDAEQRSGFSVFWFMLDSDARDIEAKIVLLAALGEDIDQTDESGNTMLHDVCLWRTSDDDEITGCPLLAELLLANGADPLAENDEGLTPVDLAGQSNNEKLIILFDIDADRSKYPILQVAGLLAASLRDGRQSIVSLLQELNVQSANALPLMESVDNDT